MKIWSLFNNIYVKNILLAVIVTVILVFAVLFWLDIYTKHGSQVEVPDVRGMQVADAAPFFEKKSLNYAVIDSIFIKNKVPGSILETVPPVGTNVKEGRTIYITVNSHTAQMLIIPPVKDMSQRQAMATLKTIGFESIEIKNVPGDWRDLVLGLETKGKALASGARVPADTPLSLLVSSGTGEISFSNDSIILENTPEESWF